MACNHYIAYVICNKALGQPLCLSHHLHVLARPKMSSSMSHVTWWSLLSCPLFSNAWHLILLTGHEDDSAVIGRMRLFASPGHFLGRRKLFYSTIAETWGKTEVPLRKQEQGLSPLRSPSQTWTAVLCSIPGLSRDSKGHRAHLSRTHLTLISFTFHPVLSFSL